ncbi:zinc ribbon domain-containing protein [Caldicellulosiruptor sp. F32]|uniref:zinc ribbon domain-containing protein n=1 Tax=Caldicellulosiruptor sp. F32 TaxID=1214564 RepID=UPI0003A4407B|nr:zinc-ribbon domain-containing protein [Caldicellulosiruptor sp. F32]
MLYCPKCGATIEKGQKVCTQCGESLEAKTSNNLQRTKREFFLEKYFDDQTKEFRVPSIKLKFDRKLLPWLYGIIGFLVFLILFVAVGKSIYSPQRVVNEFKEAVKNKDTKMLSQIIVHETGEQISQDNLKAFLELCQTKPEYINEVYKALDEAIQSISNSSSDKKNESLTDILSNLFSAHDYSNDFLLKPAGKGLIFFTKYKIAAKNYFLKVKCDTKDAKIFLNGKNITSVSDPSQEISIGPLIAGIYKIEAKYKGPYCTLEESEEEKLYSTEFSNYNQYSVELYLNPRYVEVESDFEDAEIILNGKPTGVLVKDASEFGPVSDGSEFSAKIKLPWGEARTTSVKLGSWSNSITIPNTLSNDDINNSTFEKGASVINDFEKSYRTAMTFQDPNKFLNISDELKQAFSNRIQELKDYKQKFTGKVTKTEFNFGTLQLFKDEAGKITLKVTAKIYYKDAVYSQDESSPQDIPEKVTIQVYTLVWDENAKNFVIVGIEVPWFYDWPEDGKIKEYKLDEGSV